MLAWIYLSAAIASEVVGTVFLNYTDGFTKPGPTTLTIACMTVSITLLGLALRTLPVGTAYGIWTGIGTIGTVALGIAWLGESASPLRLGCIALIVIGIVGLKMVSPE